MIYDERLLDIILKHPKAREILGDALTENRWSEINVSDYPSELLSPEECQDVETTYDFRKDHRDHRRVISEFHDAVSPEYDHQPSITTLFECLGVYWITGVEGTTVGPFYSESEGLKELDGWRSDLSFDELEDAENAMKEML